MIARPERNFSGIHINANRSYYNNALPYQHAAMPYPYLIVIHLLCATLFIGVVFFEVVILEGIRKHIGDALMPKVEEGLIRRARKVMPWVVATLFISGITMASFHWDSLKQPQNSSFGTLLAIKILLAISVLGHFITAMLKAKDGCMTSRRFELTHLSVAIHMFFIIILAKAMFYWQW